MASQSVCADTYDCHVEAYEEDFDWDKYITDEEEFEAEMEENTQKVFEPIVGDFMAAFQAQQANVAKIQADLEPVLKDIMTTQYGCDFACMDGSCKVCPDPIEVVPYNFMSKDISKVLKASNIPETISMKRRVPAAMNLMTTTKVVPETNYMSNGLMLAAIIAGGFVYKNKTKKDADDTYEPLL